MKIIGIVPARMAASRFPGKPLHPIHGRPLVEHCFRRAAFFDRWDAFYLATCDDEIATFAAANDMPCLMTSADHTRALDRVAEAAEICPMGVDTNDIVVCVQGDEPLLSPDMIEAVVQPLEKDASVYCTILTMPIFDEAEYRSPDNVKVVHNVNGDILYTSRSPIPYAREFSPELGALRIHGIFAFRWHFLKTFTELPESPLEKVEACDSNRICDNGYKQRVATVPFRPTFAVDSPGDVAKVEAAMKGDPFWGKY